MLFVKKNILLVLSFFIIFTSIFLTGCIQEDLELDNVEIRNYQGEDLSSIYDFRENSIKGPQYITKDNYKLKITGLINQPMNYSYKEIFDEFKSYKKVVTLHCVEGWSVTILWEGILIKDIFDETKPKPSANTVIFHAYDGYTTSLSLDYILDNDIIIADKMNNVTLPAQRGFPFQLVAESKWGYKWIKWITEIELSDNKEYKGYWEKRGYSNIGDIDKYFFD